MFLPSSHICLVETFVLIPVGHKEKILPHQTELLYIHTNSFCGKTEHFLQRHQHQKIDHFQLTYGYTKTKHAIKNWIVLLKRK